jgi:molecular chaperone GrpE
VAEQKPEQEDAVELNEPGEVEASQEQDAQTAAGDGPSGADGDDCAEDDAGAGQDAAALAEELEKMRDMALRAQAEAQNTKRRADQEVEKARKYALERFAGELLPVVDNLERALDAAGSDNEAVRPIAEGVELTLKSFFEALRKFNIEAIDPAGEPFDPNLHQAMSMVENPDVEPNSVIAVMQKGYTLNGRLIRPAMVMVSKAAGG